MAAKAKDQSFGVFQKSGGSYSTGGVRFVPLKAVPVTAAARIDQEHSPVKVFDSADKAEAEVERLRALFAKKTKPQK